VVSGDLVLPGRRPLVVVGVRVLPISADGRVPRGLVADAELATAPVVQPCEQVLMVGRILRVEVLAGCSSIRA
jgi:hypothetical protein